MEEQVSSEQANVGDAGCEWDAPVVPVILGGGVGSRLWPLSRADMPKHLLRLRKTEPMIATTARRLAGANCESPIIVCNADQEWLVADALAKEGVRVGSLILEPLGRNTAPAIAVAALRASMMHSNPVMVVQPADHVVSNLVAFQAAVRRAHRIATGYDKLVLLGARPTRPETGYGYIECGQAVDEELSGALVERFVEKPDLEHATEFARSEAWLWNAGIFVFTAKAILDELALLQPAILDRCRAALAQSQCSGAAVRLDRESFSAAESISIDHAIMEKSARLAVVPLDCDWMDIGSWAALWETEGKDDRGNVALGDVECWDTDGSYLRTDGRLLVSVGLRDAVVISTADAVLVADRNRSQEVKAAVEFLRDRGRREVHESHRCRRPWGSYETVVNGDGFKVKRIIVEPGAELSLQMHHHRAEHWVIVHGTARVRVNDTVELRHENENLFIPQGAKHRVANAGNIPLELIEVQVGDYLGEDDIVRFEDVYGRA